VAGARPRGMRENIGRGDGGRQEPLELHEWHYQGTGG